MGKFIDGNFNAGGSVCWARKIAPNAMEEVRHSWQGGVTEQLWFEHHDQLSQLSPWLNGLVDMFSCANKSGKMASAVALE